MRVEGFHLISGRVCASGPFLLNGVLVPAGEYDSVASALQAAAARSDNRNGGLLDFCILSLYSL